MKLAKIVIFKGNASIRSLAYLLALVGLLVIVTAFNARMTEWTGSEPRRGTARVIDGDTFDLCQVGDCKRIRLCGVNAPELDQPGYGEARQALIDMVRGVEVTCTLVGSGTVCDDRSGAQSHDRIVAQCGTGIVSDLAGELVRRGLACDLTGFTRGYYRDRFGGKAC